MPSLDLDDIENELETLESMIVSERASRRRSEFARDAVTLVGASLLMLLVLLTTDDGPRSTVRRRSTTVDSRPTTDDGLSLIGAIGKSTLHRRDGCAHARMIKNVIMFSSREQAAGVGYAHLCSNCFSAERKEP